ncbi:lactonase family protein [Paenibacillus sp. J5C_2022]|uniref:lactonase family protein n=1 Tax=Paenibacillus sp. J5C2022 TaxID=2977129 RepID=UPI0021D15F7E|nr:lactonase family protein [Paenibacillus sp. J5C2022]MCU6712824.1 lactonase family protein [Paenibacillus sp. J5C2022]
MKKGWKDGLLYIGCYGEQSETTIHVCRLDKGTGELTLLQSTAGVENASYLAIHPGGERLYAVKETDHSDGRSGGGVVSMTIGTDGLLGETTSSQSSEGAHPCYVSVAVDGRAVFVANYTGGHAALLPLTSNGELRPASSVKGGGMEEGAEIAGEGQHVKSNAHCITALPDTEYVCVADLGQDAIITYRVNLDQGTLDRHHVCRLHKGAGPRHLVFHSALPVAYVANEPDSSITLLSVDKDAGTLTPLHTYSSLPADYDGYNDSADIHLSPDDRYLYSSNRGHNSIAVFEVNEDDGKLTAVQHVSCGGELPRNFGITPDGGYLLAANHKSGTVIVFRRDAASGKLTQTEHSLAVSSPVCVRFAIS